MMGIFIGSTCIEGLLGLTPFSRDDQGLALLICELQRNDLSRPKCGVKPCLLFTVMGAHREAQQEIDSLPRAMRDRLVSHFVWGVW